MSEHKLRQCCSTSWYEPHDSSCLTGKTLAKDAQIAALKVENRQLKIAVKGLREQRAARHALRAEEGKAHAENADDVCRLEARVAELEEILRAQAEEHNIDPDVNCNCPGCSALMK